MRRLLVCNKYEIGDNGVVGSLCKVMKGRLELVVESRPIADNASTSLVVVELREMLKNIQIVPVLLDC